MVIYWCGNRYRHCTPLDNLHLRACVCPFVCLSRVCWYVCVLGKETVLSDHDVHLLHLSYMHVCLPQYMHTNPSTYPYLSFFQLSFLLLFTNCDGSTVQLTCSYVNQPHWHKCNGRSSLSPNYFVVRFISASVRLTTSISSWFWGLKIEVN